MDTRLFVSVFLELFALFSINSLHFSVKIFLFFVWMLTESKNFRCKKAAGPTDSSTGAAASRSFLCHFSMSLFYKLPIRLRIHLRPPVQQTDKGFVAQFIDQLADRHP